MKKRILYSEVAFVMGLVLLAWGTAMTAWGDLGISMVVAPAFILHLKMSEIYPWFSFGVAEYILQGFVLILMMCILRKVKLSYFLSFLTAICYGLLLDLGSTMLAFLPQAGFWLRLTVYIVGDLWICAGIALLFHTYLPPEAYEMFVIELAPRLNMKLHILKTVYDCISLIVSIVMALALLGEFRGIGIGTVVCAFLNGSLIQFFSVLFDRIWVFQDKLPYRHQLTESEESL